MNDKERNDLQLTISHALQEMEAEAGDKFDLSKVNLEELRRRTGIPRKKLRLIKKNGFIVKPHGLSGTRKKDTGYTGTYVQKKGIHGGKPVNQYPSIYFSNYWPIAEEFDSPDQADEYFSELRCTGNLNEINCEINRFIKKLIDLHNTYIKGSMTRDDYLRSIDNNLANVLSESK